MRTSHPILRQIALAIAISAIAATAASARPNPAPSRTAQSQTATASLVVRPNPDQQTGQPGMVVRPNPDQQTVTGATTHTGLCSEVCSGGGYGYVTPSSPAPNQTGATLPHDPRSRPTVLSTEQNTASAPATAVPAAPDDSFDWRDAGIGAGAALVLVAIGLAGTRAATNSRKRHPRERRATASN